MPAPSSANPIQNPKSKIENPESLRYALAQAIRTLSAAGIDTPRLDAQVLLAYFLKKEQSWLIAHDGEQLTSAQSVDYGALVARRANHEPVAYLTGQRAFFGRIFQVDPRVLIPRPETELLVEAVLAHASACPHPHPLTAADIGTGSGIIAISLAAHAPQLTLYAVDASTDALAVAQANAAALLSPAAPPITFLHGDLLAPLPGPVDIIAANLPYIPDEDYRHLQPNVRDYEPATALASGPDGLAHIRRLLRAAPASLRPKGAIFLEIGHDQGPAVTQLAAQAFPHSHITIQPDLAGHDRLAIILTA